jgi:hypothetical protein
LGEFRSGLILRGMKKITALLCSFLYFTPAFSQITKSTLAPSSHSGGSEKGPAKEDHPAAAAGWQRLKDCAPTLGDPPAPVSSLDGDHWEEVSWNGDRLLYAQRQAMKDEKKKEAINPEFKNVAYSVDGKTGIISIGEKVDEKSGQVINGVQILDPHTDAASYHAALDKIENDLTFGMMKVNSSTPPLNLTPVKTKTGRKTQFSVGQIAPPTLSFNCGMRLVRNLRDRFPKP